MLQLLPRVVLAAVFGLLFSQSAEFTQQYLQRLGGAADELAEVVRRFDESAAQSGLSREAAIRRLTSNADRFVARQGSDAAETVARFEDVARRYRELAEAVPLVRPFVAAGDPDWRLMRRAGEDFRPALPVTADGLVLTLAGFAAGWATGAGAAGATRMIRRRRRLRRA